VYYEEVKKKELQAEEQYCKLDIELFYKTDFKWGPYERNTRQ
jgi:hypothetical protein